MFRTCFSIVSVKGFLWPHPPTPKSFWTGCCGSQVNSSGWALLVQWRIQENPEGGAPILRFSPVVGGGGGVSLVSAFRIWNLIFNKGGARRRRPFINPPLHTSDISSNLGAGLESIWTNPQCVGCTKCKHHFINTSTLWPHTFKVISFSIHFPVLFVFVHINWWDIGLWRLLIYVRDYVDAKIGCVPVAYYLLCNCMPRELPGRGTHSPTLRWQFLGCAMETPRMFVLAWYQTQIRLFVKTGIWNRSILPLMWPLPSLHKCTCRLDSSQVMNIFLVILV